MIIDNIQKTTDKIPRETLGINTSAAVPPQHERKAEESAINDKTLFELIEKANDEIKSSIGILHFKLHKESERYYVQVFDTKSQRVIKTIPSEEFLDVVGKIRESVGLLIDEKK